MNPKLTSSTTKKHLLTKQRERGWGAYREGRDRGGEVLGDGEVGAARAGSGSGGGGPGRACAVVVRSRAAVVRSRVATVRSRAATVRSSAAAGGGGEVEGSLGRRR